MKRGLTNENNEVFIKLSRSKLMALLNIKSTHKAAIVMKELVENELIIYKKVGLNRCNEIYVYTLEDSGSKGKSKPKQTLIYNFVYEANIKMTSHIKYNFGW